MISPPHHPVASARPTPPQQWPGPGVQPGQATLEFLGVMPLLVLCAAACVQAMLLALTLVYAQAAADSSARAMHAGVRGAALPVPRAWRRAASVRPSAGKVVVELRAPRVMPGVPARLLAVRAAAPLDGGSSTGTQ